MKKIAHYCILVLAALFVSDATAMGNELIDNDDGESNFLGCLNPLYQVTPNSALPKKISAASMDIDSNGKIVLSGDIEIPISGGLIKAVSADYDSDNKAIEEIKEGNIYYLESYFKFESGSLNETTKNFNFLNGKSYLSARNLLINYQSLSGDLGSNLIFKNAQLTSCLDAASGWEITAKTISINENSKRGFIKNLSLKVRNKTFLKFPYLPFAVSTERLSGFLEPDIGITSDGFDLYLPYFLILSDRSDVTVAPRILKKRGAGLEANLRYITDTSSDNYFDLMFFSEDKEARKNYSIDDSRWAFKLKDSRKLQKFKGQIDWAKSSDPMVLLDLPSNLINIASQRDHYLPQFIKVSGNIQNLDFSLARQGFQSLNPFIGNGYIKKPEFILNYESFDGPISYFGKLQYTDFSLERSNNKFLFSEDDLITGSRAISDIGASFRYPLGAVNIETNGSITTKKYDLERVNYSKGSTSIPSFGITASTALRGKLKTGTSLITPSFSYEKTEYKNQSSDPIFDLHVKNSNYFNSIKQDLFFGEDRIADQEYFLAKMKWRVGFNNKKGMLFQVTKKHELEASRVINQMLGIALDADRQSGFKAEWNGSSTSAFLEANYTDRRNELNFANAVFNFLHQDTNFSISRKFRRQVPFLDLNNELDYGELTIEHSLISGYKVLAGISKDLASQKNLASYFGIGYENCCFAFKLFASDKRLSKYNYLDRNSSFTNKVAWDEMISVENKSRINFEFELKGITGSRTQLNKFFSSTFANF